MDDKSFREPMLELFVFETNQLLGQLEQLIMDLENKKGANSEIINEIFRIMHTIKGSSAMMMYEGISSLAHKVEDLFYFIREKNPQNINYLTVSDLVLRSIDFIKNEIISLEEGKEINADAKKLKKEIQKYLESVKDKSEDREAKLSEKEEAQNVAESMISGNSKSFTEISENEYSESKSINVNNNEINYYISSLKKFKDQGHLCFEAVVFFEEACEMENIRAFSIIHNLKELVTEVYYKPSGIIEDDSTAMQIREEGFSVYFSTTRTEEDIRDFFNKVVFMKTLILNQLDCEFEKIKEELKCETAQTVNTIAEVEESKEENKTASTLKTNIISVNITKVDKLMDLLGELVISEAMVTHNSDLDGLVLDNFNKASRQLRKIINELQDIVMSIRMVPLSATFQKMHRIVRDMSKKLNREVKLELLGEETEVDKNIIDHLGDPLMHLVRNSLDHGIESPEERINSGKPPRGIISIEARNSGGEVWIIIKDDGRGLDRNKILKKAIENGLVKKNENEISDKEIYSFIFQPGFSTKEKVTEFSGRGVGMDVVTKNVEKTGGCILVDSLSGQGTQITIKIPLTLAIIDGMEIKVGESRLIIPTISIKESFRMKAGELITDPNNNEMVMVRGQCYPILRLSDRFKMTNSISKIDEGIIVMVENNDNTICIFADELVGEHQIVVKALPAYIKKVNGVSGCTLLGDGSICLILDIPSIVDGYFG